MIVPSNDLSSVTVEFTLVGALRRHVVDQSHGPSSTTGHPLRWSSGQKRVYYMPSEGPTKYYGDYFVAEAGPPTGADLYGATLLPAALQGNSDVAASAAQAYVAGNSGGFVGVR